MQKILLVIHTSIDLTFTAKFSFGSLGEDGVIFTGDAGNRLHEHIEAAVGTLLVQGRSIRLEVAFISFQRGLSLISFKRFFSISS